MRGEAGGREGWLGSGMSRGAGQGWGWRVCLPAAPRCTHPGDSGSHLLQTWMNAPSRSMGAARELTASTPPAPTAVPAPRALLGTATSAKVRSGVRMGGLEGPERHSHGGWIPRWPQWSVGFPTCTDPPTHPVGAGEDRPSAFGATGQSLSPWRQSSPLDSECMEPYGCGERENLLTSWRPSTPILSDQVPYLLPGPDLVTCPPSSLGYLPAPWNPG